MKIIRTIHFCWIIVLLSNCKQPYEPPAIRENLGALVVDGFINNSTDTTFIRLSRTRTLDDIYANPAETGANLSLEDESGNVIYNFQESTNRGEYIVPGMALDLARQYKLRIFTADSREYVSDAIPVLKTPPVDSITWEKDGSGVSIAVNTHDPSNNTRYYRWEYSETWQYRTPLISAMIYIDHQIRDRQQDEYVYECWKTQLQKQLLFASSERLATDIIYHHTLRQIEQDAIELSVRYFILVKQYALTKEYYQYLELLKKLSEQGGSVFDIQPSTLTGNIHAVNNSDVPVIGYVAASTVETQQLFINTAEVQPWQFRQLCAVLDATGDLDIFFGGGAYIPLYYDKTRSVFVATEAICGDCTKRGGTVQRPGFW